MSDAERGRGRRAALVTLVVLGLIALALGSLLQPLRAPRFDARAQRLSDYGEAVARLEALGNDDTCALRPECATILMTHGGRTGRVVVLFHGLSNCPAQFDSLGRMLHARGANVVIPVLPRHGCADRMTTSLARLDARELVTFADQVLDAAAGLGDSLTVAGLSLGGVLAAWAAQERPDVDRAVVIAPMFGIALAPGRLSNAVARVYRALPNRFQWWDPRAREALPGPDHVYPRWSTRSIEETLWLGAAVAGAASRQAPAARAITLVTVGHDLAVDNRRAAEVAERWRAHGADVESVSFPDSLHLNHDLIDPEQVGARPALVYPKMVGMLLRGTSRR